MWCLQSVSQFCREPDVFGSCVACNSSIGETSNNRNTHTVQTHFIVCAYHLDPNHNIDTEY